MKNLSPSVLVLLALSATARAGDLYVGGSRPGAYPTLQAALDAAVPGDRILLEAAVLTGGTVIRKSVTIENSGQGAASIGACGAAAALQVTALTPGVPLVLRRLDVTRGGCYATPQRLLVGNAPGDVVIEDCRFVDSDFGNDEVPVCVDLTCSSLWIRNTQIIVRDRLTNNACIDTYGFSGGSALSFVGQRLIIEDSVLQGASAASLRYAPWCGEYPYGGNGGFALRAGTNSTVLVRTQLIDGNGSDIENANWQIFPQPGGHTPSTLIRPSGTFQAYASTWQHGRDGQLGWAGRLPPDPVGLPDALLQVNGTGQIGSMAGISFAVPVNQIAVAVFFLGWIDGVWTPAGTIWVDPTTAFFTLVFVTSGNVTLQVPNDPYLAGTPVILQGCTVGSSPLTLSNPAGLVFRM